VVGQGNGFFIGFCSGEFGCSRRARVVRVDGLDGGCSRLWRIEGE
jgi:hypothetical protein